MLNGWWLEVGGLIIANLRQQPCNGPTSSSATAAIIVCTAGAYSGAKDVGWSVLATGSAQSGGACMQSLCHAGFAATGWPNVQDGTASKKHGVERPGLKSQLVV